MGLRRFARRAAFISETVGVYAVLFILALTVVDVIGAKVFLRPVRGSTELVGFAQLVAIAGGMAMACFAGRHVALEFVVDKLPKPAQRPRPPIIIGGFGAKRTPRLAATFADEYNVPFHTVEETAQAFDRVRRACEETGRQVLMSAAQTVCVGRDAAELERRAAAIGTPLDQLREGGAERLAADPERLCDLHLTQPRAGCKAAGEDLAAQRPGQHVRGGDAVQHDTVDAGSGGGAGGSWRGRRGGRLAHRAGGRTTARGPMAGVPRIMASVRDEQDLDDLSDDVTTGSPHRWRTVQGGPV